MQSGAEPRAGTLRVLPRLAWTLGAWAAIWAAGPGVLGLNPQPLLGLFGLTLWGLAAARPGRFAFAVDWLGGALGLGGTMWWIQFVFPAGLPIAAVGMGLYVACGGALLRRLASPRPEALGVGGGLSLGLALPLAWVAAETLRDLLPPPFGMGWLRIGHLGVGVAPLANALSTVGVVGLSIAFAALAGGLLELILRRSLRRAAAGFGLSAGVLALGLATPPGPVEAGPRVLVVQPGLTMSEKRGRDPRERFAMQLEQLRAGLEQSPRPDLVLWPETSVGFELGSPGLDEAIAVGAELPAWQLDRGLQPAHLSGLDGQEEQYIGRSLMRLLPPGTALLAGAEQWVVEDRGQAPPLLRRRNVAALWTPEGERALGAKQHLAPGGETLFGLEGFGPLRRYVLDVAGYVPDFLAGDETGLGHFAAGSEVEPAGFTASLTVCFDNAFVGPYLRADRAGAELHTVLSNEAWYRTSIELDQMIAFSRAIAAMTRSPVVRCTNSGISAAIGPDGRVLARLTRGGLDREIGGWMSAELPLPAGRSGATFYSRWHVLLRLVAALAGPLCALLLAWARRRRAV